MNLEKEVIEKFKTLPEHKQAEAVDFIDFLQKRAEEREQEGWGQFSLASAMRGMEDEDDLYTIEDLKEKFHD
ncbi:MAG: DUF2281 domain-containing protein [Desulfobacterales bacterium]|nr:DUF2281 domain-containing protein [Desulfobacterales bacterium]